jgi:hypothetical protein
LHRGLHSNVSASISDATEDGNVKALLQILYDQYLILGALGSYIYVLDLKTKFFCRKKNHPWTRDSQCQNRANSLAEKTPNASKNFSPICLPKPKSFEFLKKSSLGVGSPCLMTIVEY